MGMFRKKENESPGVKELLRPATIIVTSNSIPSHNKATYWFEVSLNNKIVGNIEKNGIPSIFTTTTDKNVLELILVVKENNGNITKFKTRKQELELKDGETINALFENRRFIIS